MAGVYISWPFCSQKCTYCNFASGVFPAELEARYAQALIRELRNAEWPWTPETVYLGGGTPSRIPFPTLLEILHAIPGRPWLEATMEAAPGSLGADRISLWRSAGIERVSLGVQSFIESELRKTGRKHTAEVVAQDVRDLREAGIGNINIDLIAGLAGQTPESWERSLDGVEALDVPHVSVYMFEVDEDSRLGLEVLNAGARYGARDLPSDDAIAQMYERAVIRLSHLGIARYEISNFAKPGWASRHNLKYWRLEAYLGFGADAHSFDGRDRWRNVETAAEYAQAADPRIPGVAADFSEERFFVGLRLDEGILVGEADRQRHGAAIRRWMSEGLLEESTGRLRLTPRGVLLSNEVFQEFLSA